MNLIKNKNLLSFFLLTILIEAKITAADTPKKLHTVRFEKFYAWTQLQDDAMIEKMSMRHVTDIIDEGTKQSLLHHKALKGKSNAVAQLIENGAETNRADKFGITPLHQAMFSGSAKTVELLLENGADIYKEEYIYRDSPLSLALRPESSVSDEIRQFIIKEDSLLQNGMIRQPIRQKKSPDTITVSHSISNSSLSDISHGTTGSTSPRKTVKSPGTTTFIIFNEFFKR